ncbi:hypothetical protein LCGC14_1757770 [marine sediment metagenome]|uniref:Uncharacterized protein n=1 Tax=marine sediment metagenome TaxID=412755 RepID=A0A0F9JH29_9ZZZZ
MANTMTTQGVSAGPPSEEQQALGITMWCHTCNTLRTFTVQDSLQWLLDRKAMGLWMESVCEQCGRTYRVALHWMGTTSGFSYRPPDPRVFFKATTVRDSAGMVSREGRGHSNGEGNGQM